MDLPNDILSSIKIPVPYKAGEIYIEEDIYSNFLIIKNNNLLPIELKSKIRNLIIAKLQNNIDYQIGCTWTGEEWSHGPADFPITDNCFVRFVMPSGFPTYKIYQNNILDKVANLVDNFSSELSIKYHINEDLSNRIANKMYLIYYSKEMPFNFKRISKNF